MLTASPVQMLDADILPDLVTIAETENHPVPLALDPPKLTEALVRGPLSTTPTIVKLWLPVAATFVALLELNAPTS